METFYLRPYLEKIYQDVDPGIRPIVKLLNEAGFETFTSCQGGEGHSFFRPTVGIFVHGDYFEFREKFVEFLKPHVGRFILNLKSDHGFSRSAVTQTCYLELYSLDDIVNKN
jgi:hypothetical protein